MDERIKKSSDSVMDNPMRTATGAGFGSSTNTSATQLNTENSGKAAIEGDHDLRFRCSDVADKSCKFEARGRSEEELMPQIERHGREAHNITSIDDNMRQRIRSNIRAA